MNGHLKFNLDIPAEYVEREIQFVIPGHPRQKKSPKLIALKSKATGKVKATAQKDPENVKTAYEIKQRYMAAMGYGPDVVPEPHLGPVVLLMCSYFGLPSVSNKKALELDGYFYTNMPDSDRLSNMVQDSLKHIAWKDDSQCQILSWKMYGKKEYAFVKLIFLKDVRGKKAAVKKCQNG